MAAIFLCTPTNTKSNLYFKMSKRVHFVASRTANLSKSRKGDQARGGVRKEGSKPKKKLWDPTVSDLSVHKLSNNELEKRRRSHQSKNIEVAKHDLYEKAKENFDLDDAGNFRLSSPLTTKGSGQKLAVLQRSLQGKELHEVLAESDRALRVVKDMFGDDPKRYTGQPNVTVAPYIMSDKAILERTLMESKRDGPFPTAAASPGGIRDVSVQELAPNKPALNELPSPTELRFDESRDTTLTPETPDPSTTPQAKGCKSSIDLATTPTPETPDPSTTPQAKGYKSSIDLKRFQSIIQREELVASETSDLSMNPDLATNPKHFHRPLHDQELKPTARPHLPETPQQTVCKQESIVVNKPQPVLQDRSLEIETGNALHVPISTAGSLSRHDDSVTGLSDISTIPDTYVVNTGILDNKGEGSVTVDPDTSALLNQDDISQARPILLSAHPLHVAHKMTPVKREETTQKIHLELQELEKLVRGLDRELRDFEQTEPYMSTPTAPPTLTSDPSNCPPSGITSSMYAAVTRMTHYLQESEAQMKGEIEVRGHLLQTMTEQQNLMDALTSDMVNLQKETVVLRKELLEVQHYTSEQLLAMQREISDIHKTLSRLGTPMWSPQPLPHEAIHSITPLQYVQRQVQTKGIESLPHPSRRSPDYLQESRPNQHQHKTYLSSGVRSSLAESSNGDEAYTHTSASHPGVKNPDVLSTRTPTTVQTSSTWTPTNVQTSSTRTPTTLQTLSTRTPTTVQTSSTMTPTTVQTFVRTSSSTRSPSGVPYIYAQQSPLHINSSTALYMPHTDNPSTADESTVDQVPHGSRSSFPYPQHPQLSLASQSTTLDNSAFSGTFAPSPPPLSLALQVPAVAVSTSVADTRTNSSRSRLNVKELPSSTPKSSGISLEQVPGSVEPAFDVTGFLNSLENMDIVVARENPNDPQFASGNSQRPHLLSLSKQGAMVHQTPSLVSVPSSTNTTSTFEPSSTVRKGSTGVLTSKEKTIANQSSKLQSQQTFQAPNLSVSLLSLPTEPTGSTITASDVSFDSELENDHPVGLASRIHSAPSWSADPQHTQDHAGIDSSLPAGWFALTSHLAHH